MQGMTIVSGQFKKTKHHTFTLHLHCTNNWCHGAAIQPELHCTDIQTLSDKVGQAGVRLDEGRHEAVQLSPCVGQGGT